MQKTYITLKCFVDEDYMSIDRRQTDSHRQNLKILIQEIHVCEMLLNCLHVTFTNGKSKAKFIKQY